MDMFDFVVGAGQNQVAANNAWLDYLASIYGYNTQGNIATTQGEYGLENQKLQNEGLTGVANINNTGATERTNLDNQGANYRTGLSEQSATNRSLFDNVGADYRTGLNADAQLAASAYPTAVGSDRFGAVFNGMAAPLMQQWFGIQPGSPYQTRAMPQLSRGPGPDYMSLISGQVPPQAPAPGGAAPQAPAAPPMPGGPRFDSVGAGGGFRPMMPKPGMAPAPGVSPAPLGGVARMAPPSPMPRPGMPPQAPTMPGGAFRPPAPTPSPGGMAGPGMPSLRPIPMQQAPRPGAPAMPQAPASPMGGMGGSTTPSVLKPLPTSVGGPQITTGPVASQGLIQGLVGQQQGANAARAGGLDRTAERATAAAGFGGGSPALMAMKQQNSIARNFADQDASISIPAAYAQANASQRLSSEQAASNVYNQRIQEELARRQQESGFQQNILNYIMGLAG